MIAEQAGGGATTGKNRVMGFTSESIHQRISFAIGSLYEVDQYEKAYKEYDQYG
jgi:fructose-1,6-bisphosphatase